MAGFYKGTIVYKDTLSKLSRLIMSGEDITLSWMPDGGRTFTAQKFMDDDFLAHLIPKAKLQNIHFVYIDQSIGVKYINEHILASINIFGNYKDTKSGLFDVINNGKKIFFLVDNFSYDEELFLYLNSLRSIGINQVHFIFFVLQSELELLNSNYNNTSSIIFHNIQPIGYLSRKEAFDWLQKRSKQMGMKISIDSILRAVKFSGGIPSLLDSCIRYIYKYKNFEDAINSPEMKIIISKLWSRFSKGEKRYIQKSFFGALTNEDKQLSEVQSLKNFRVLDKKFAAIGGWIAYALETRSVLSIEARDDKLIIDEIDYSDTFNDSEKKFLILLLSYDKVILKEELGELLFADGDYTDWAIDKFISRLRKKIRQIGLGRDIVVTVRGQGYRSGGLNVQISDKLY